MKYLGRMIPFIIVGLFFHMSAFGASPLKIGVVDMQAFQKNSRAFQRIRMKIKKQFDAMQEKIKSEQNELKKLEENYKKQSIMLSLDAKEDKRREVEKKRRYIKYLSEDFSFELKNTEKEATQDLLRELGKILEKIGKEQGYLLILERRTLGLLYYRDAIEITDQVVKAYDKLHP
ncbi:MAG: OmpH family outer membrane protein [Deltaproteobacteria bacterium]|nr:OmpH family outer membrane protein [Deltaproteobacteria bacterium]